METWKRWDVPRNEGSRLHQFGTMQLCVAVDTAGEGDILSTVALYPEPAAPGSRKSRPVSALALPSFSDRVWTRYLLGNETGYELIPAYPSLPNCVKLTYPFSLPAGTEVDGWIFSRIEVGIRVGETAIASYPMVKPFKTLYGTPDAGVVCRYDEAEFLASEEPVVSSLHADPRYVAHPVRLKNTSQTPIVVSELCIYGEQLSIFSVGPTMRSERLLFLFSASGVRMSLDGQLHLPAGATTIVKPVVSGEERFIVRSFELFKTMTRI